jgi:hypothetical protein
MYDRYHLLTWLLTCLVTLVWVNVEGRALIEQRFSGLREFVAKSPSASRMRLALARLVVFYGFGADRLPLSQRLPSATVAGATSP